MDTNILTACLLASLLVVVIAYLFGRPFIPGCVMPFAELPEQEQQRISRQKLCRRGLALTLFALAALTMFSALPRGITLGLTFSGFFCQYSVFCLRRRFPCAPSNHPHATQLPARHYPMEER